MNNLDDLFELAPDVQIVVRTYNRTTETIEGKGILSELFPGYQVHLVKEPDGTLHIIGENSDNLIKRTELPENSSTTKTKNTPKKEPIVDIDTIKVRDYACGLYKNAKSDPRKRKLIELLEATTHKDQLNQTFLKAGCGVGYVSFSLNGLLYSHLDKQNQNGGGTWFTQHQSNFSLGLVSMIAMDQCLSAMHPTRRSQILASTLGIATAANIYFEYNFAGDLQHDPLDRKKIVTDWNDLSTGFAAEVTYLLSVLAIESSFRFKFSQVCK